MLSRRTVLAIVSWTSRFQLWTGLIVLAYAPADGWDYIVEKCRNALFESAKGEYMQVTPSLNHTN